jgi:hypothetical protein
VQTEKPDDKTVIVTVTIDAAPERVFVSFTEVTLTHGLNPSVAARDLHEQGWQDCIGRLVERCAAS